MIRVRARIQLKGRPATYLDIDDGPAFLRERLGVSMSDLERLKGDGAAHVTVSMERSDKNFGTGVSAFCSVTLTCNMDEDTVEEAQSWAADLVSGFLPEVLDQVQELYPPEEDRDRE